MGLRLEVQVEACRREEQVNPLLHSTPRRDLEAFGPQSRRFHAAKKNLDGDPIRRPYRKPTQVDEERILRRLSDPLRRNSAI